MKRIISVSVLFLSLLFLTSCKEKLTLTIQSGTIEGDTKNEKGFYLKGKPKIRIDGLKSDDTFVWQNDTTLVLRRRNNNSVTFDCWCVIGTGGCNTVITTPTGTPLSFTSGRLSPGLGAIDISCVEAGCEGCASLIVTDLNQVVIR